MADELYALPLEDFTKTRNERAGQAKDAGDKELAARIKELAKPTTAAWLANQLVREHGDELTPLLQLGADLRAATASLSGEQLKALGRQQHQLVHALVQQARHLASERGKSVSDDVARGVEDTLRAALADEESGRVLASGRLTDTLDPGGFHIGGEDAPRPAAARPAAAKERRTPAQGADRRRAALERAEQELADAERRAQRSADEHAAARTALDEAQAGVEQRRRDVDELRHRLDEAHQAAAQSEREQRDARKVLERAERASHEAEQRVSDARSRLERLRDQ